MGLAKTSFVVAVVGLVWCAHCIVMLRMLQLYGVSLFVMTRVPVLCGVLIASLF